MPLIISLGLRFILNGCFTPYQKQISELCKEYEVQRLFAFGSVLTDKFNEASDVDLLVGFDKMKVCNCCT